MDKITEFEGAVFVKMSPDLLRWCTIYAPKNDGVKLKYEEKDGVYYYSKKGLGKFSVHLQSPWAKPTNGARPTIPLGIKTEIKKEAEHRCPVCRTNAGELAHIDPVSLTFNNHPHNLIYLCPNHHTYYDYGHKYNNVEKQEIKDYKKSLLNFQITQWKLQGNIINSYMSAINIIGRIKEIEVEILKILTPLEFDNFFLKVIDKIDSINKSDQNVSEATNLVTKLGSKTFKSNKDKAYSFFENKPKLLTIIKENNHSINCPLCKGNGYTRYFDTCPPCAGEGILSEEQISNIDFDQYNIENCPLCIGNGCTDHFDTCPPCAGEGKLSKEQISNIDFDQYDIENCPLSKGNGFTDYYDTCPACGGEGEISKEQISNIDFNDFIK